MLVREQLGEARQTGAENGRCRKVGVRLEHGKGGDIDDGAAALCHHDRRHQPGRTNDVEQVVVQPQMPVLVADLQHRSLGAVTRAVDQRVDAAKPGHRALDKGAQIGRFKIGAGEAETAQRLRQRLALAAGRQDGDRVTQLVHLSGGISTDTAAPADDHCDGLFRGRGHQITAFSRKGRPASIRSKPKGLRSRLRYSP